MKALVKYRSGDGFVDLKDVSRPRMKDDEVLIEVKACGICGTDIHIYHGEFQNDPPVILGHEFSGEIAEVGPAVGGWKLGDRVSSELHTEACTSCYLCRNGKPDICPHKRPIGSRTDGAFAEYLKVPSWLLHRLPENLSFEEGSLGEPVAIAVHALLERGRIKEGDFVFVLGAGTIGLLSAQVARWAGAGTVMIADFFSGLPIRLKAAQELGIDHIVDVKDGNHREKVLELTGGIGADVVVDASGAEEAITDAFGAVKRAGSLVAIGLTKSPRISIPWNEGILKEVKVVFPFSSVYTSWEKAFSLISQGEVNIGPLMTHRFPLEKWKEAFMLVERKEAIKALLLP